MFFFLFHTFFNFQDVFQKNVKQLAYWKLTLKLKFISVSIKAFSQNFIFLNKTKKITQIQISC